MQRVTNIPHGTFTGRNMMTPDILGFYRVSIGAGFAYVELSTGSGFFGGEIFGVTVRRAGGERLDPDPSGCYESKADALEAIKKLEQ